MSDCSNKSRRAFVLASAALVATTILGPGVTLYARPIAGAAPGSKRWGILIDTNKCTPDCDVCVKACSTEFGLIEHGRPQTDPQWIRKVTLEDKVTGRTQSLPVMCQHCEHPPCVDVCPTGASFKREDGIVLVNRHICIGCRYCVLACPYKARNFVHEDVTDQKAQAPRGKGTAEACTMCVHRIDAGRIPACVEACDRDAQGAMLFGDLNDPDSDIAKRVAAYASAPLRPELQTNPAVRYQGL
jgi:molybdopterin-containing oxidoreductase family iron-sulfur binding subunit